MMCLKSADLIFLNSKESRLTRPSTPWKRRRCAFHRDFSSLVLNKVWKSSIDCDWIVCLTFISTLHQCEVNPNFYQGEKLFLEFILHRFSSSAFSFFKVSFLPISLNLEGYNPLIVTNDNKWKLELTRK